ncbi:tripartite tricarboxylate transporter substrate binding protein [Arthrobacter sp. H14]|uniref:tripartite tricarboxylate transporter substrate binding protein n=1 Tax=Arthrobacter sp. H14 TaxID=1312959 RepID=UPI00047A087B|nr:tripartite tricarboxylate transporter substrate binding protein [Arthrobacter sp. H14]
MNRRTKFAVPALTAVAALALSACGGGSGSEGGGNAATGEFTAPENVRMIVPFSAGGGSDLAGRAIASGLEEVTDSTVTVENITGGDGAIGYSELLASNGDPSQLLASETALMTLPIVQDVEFTYKDFTPIMKLGDDYNVMMVRAGSPHETCIDVIEEAKEGGMITGISGATGPEFVAWGLIEDQFDVAFEPVVFESGAEITAALLGNHIDVAMTNPGEALGQFESGDLKPLCVLAPERYTYEPLADVPTGVEQGVDVTFAQWRGFIAPGGLSEEAKQHWVDAAKAYAETDAYDEYIESNLLQPQVLYGDEFTAFLDEYNANLESVLGGQ